MAAAYFIACLALVALTVAQDMYTHSATLAANYKLEWKLNTTHIGFRTNVKSSGWFGLGVSKNGSMFPGDVVMGYFANGVPVFNDYNTAGHFPPALDKSQDWTLVSASNGHHRLTFEFSRAFRTGDSEDLAIHRGVSHVIWAYSNDIPTSPTGVPYHSTARGSMDLNLVDIDIVGK